MSSRSTPIDDPVPLGDAVERHIPSLNDPAPRFGHSAYTRCETLEHYRPVNPAVFNAPLELA